MKMQKSTLPKFKFSILEKFGFEKNDRDIKTEILIFKQFGFAKTKKSAPQNQKLES